MPKTISAPDAMNEAYNYETPVAFSRGMEITIADTRMVFVSGTASIGKNGETLYVGDIEAQVKRAFENVAQVLAASDMTWKNVVKVTIYLKNIDFNYSIFNDARSDYFKRIGLITYPASTCVEANLCRHDLLVEMDCVAVGQIEKESNLIKTRDWECL